MSTYRTAYLGEDGIMNCHQSWCFAYTYISSDGNLMCRQMQLDNHLKRGEQETHIHNN